VVARTDELRDDIKAALDDLVRRPGSVVPINTRQGELSV
jgi:hypothetical protein